MAVCQVSAEEEASGRRCVSESLASLSKPHLSPQSRDDPSLEELVHVFQ